MTVVNDRSNPSRIFPEHNLNDRKTPHRWSIYPRLGSLDSLTVTRSKTSVW